MYDILSYSVDTQNVLTKHRKDVDDQEELIKTRKSIFGSTGTHNLCIKVNAEASPSFLEALFENDRDQHLDLVTPEDIYAFGALSHELFHYLTIISTPLGYVLNQKMTAIMTSCLVLGKMMREQGQEISLPLSACFLDHFNKGADNHFKDRFNVLTSDLSFLKRCLYRDFGNEYLPDMPYNSIKFDRDGEDFFVVPEYNGQKDRIRMNVGLINENLASSVEQCVVQNCTSQSIETCLENAHGLPISEFAKMTDPATRPYYMLSNAIFCDLPDELQTGTIVMSVLELALLSCMFLQGDEPSGSYVFCEPGELILKILEFLKSSPVAFARPQDFKIDRFLREIREHLGLPGLHDSVDEFIAEIQEHRNEYHEARLSTAFVDRFLAGMKLRKEASLLSVRLAFDPHFVRKLFNICLPATFLRIRTCFRVHTFVATMDLTVNYTLLILRVALFLVMSSPVRLITLASARGHCCPLNVMTTYLKRNAVITHVVFSRRRPNFLKLWVLLLQ